MPNTAPVLTDLVSTVAYLESLVNTTPQRLDTNVTLVDPEGNFDGGIVSLYGLYTADRLATDRFGINNQGAGAGAGQIGVSGSNVTYGGVTIGTYTGGIGTPLEVHLNASATTAAVDALLQNLTYASVSDTPVAGHNLVLNVRDAAGADLGLIGSVTTLAGAANPFDGLGSAQLSFQVAPAFLDYDNDGDADIFTGGDDGQVRLLRNNGNGTFTQQVGASNPFNGFDIGEGSAIAFADMDNDGDRDAFVTDGLDGFAIRWRNNGNGTFTNMGVVSGFYRGSEQNARTGVFDVDGDGDGDFVVGGRDGTLQVWLNNGNGTVSATGSHPFTGIVLPNGSFPSPTFADLDGDGDQDLAVGISDGPILFYANQGGVFTRIADESNPFWGTLYNQNPTPAFGDFDKDGDLDMVIGSSAGTGGRLDTVRNDSIQWGQIIHIDLTPVSDAPAGTSKSVTITEDSVRKLAVADFGFTDSDGNSFVGVQFTAAPVGGTLYYDADGSGAGAAVAVTGFPTATFVVADIAAGKLSFVPTADLAGAGAASLSFAVVDNGSTVNGGQIVDATPNALSFDIIALNDGPRLAGLADPAYFTLTGAATPHRIDFDVSLSDPEGNLANGQLTLGGFGAANQLAQDQLGVRNQGTGPGQIGVSGATVSFGGIPIGTLSGGANGTPLVIDFNGNATVAAVEALVENLTYANSSGAPTIDRTMLLNIVDGAGGYVDLQGGFTELAGVANPFNGLGSGQLSFQVAPAFLDYDNDSDADIFTGGDDGQVRLLRNNGNGTFTQQVGASNPFNGFDIGEGSAIAFADMDNDGDRDAFVTDGLDGFAIRWRNNGNGTFTNMGVVSGFYRGTEQNARTGVFDVDGDGDGDFVVGGRDGTLQVWTNNGNGTVSATGSHPFTGIVLPSGSFPSPGFGDYDGDGDQDLAVGISDGPVIFYANEGGVFVRAPEEDNPFAFNLWAQNPTPAFGDIDGDGDADLVIGYTALGLGGRLATLRNDTAQGIAFHIQFVQNHAVDDSFNVNENAVVTGNLLANDEFGSPGTVTAVNGQAGGVGSVITLASGAKLTVNANGSFTFNTNGSFASLALFGTGASNQSALETFTYTLSNGNVATVAVTVRGVYSVPHYLIGTAGNDVITGSAQDDLFGYSAGADQMSGSGGNDLYRVENAGDQVFESAGGGNDTVEARISYSIAGTSVEVLKLIGPLAFDATGNNLANTILGNNRDNILDGGVGADEMKGYDGDDTYYVDNIGDACLETINDGTDIVYASVTFTLAGQFLEQLYLTGAAAINGGGNSLNNRITGNSAANILAGADGNDRLIGGAGADTMKGGLGNDVFEVDNVADKVQESSGEGTDTVESTVTFSLAGEHIEVLKLVGGANINGAGNTLANTLYGNTGNNVLNGATGADDMYGGEGDDKFIVDNVADHVLELAGEGNDLVESAVTFSLVNQYVEALTLTGAAATNGQGNFLDNVILGNAAVNTLAGADGNDRLDGGAGADTMKGGIGNDVFVVDNAGDNIIESGGEGSDTVESSIGYTLGGALENLTLTGASSINGTGNGQANTLIGNAAVNTLSGLLGSDEIHGGLGNDVLVGGGGADGFWFDTAIGAANVDTINDFTAVDDTIHLDRSIFGGIAADGVLAAGAFRIGTVAVDADDRIVYDQPTGNIYYDADGAGGAVAVLFVKVTAATVLSAADFFADP